MHTMAVKMHVRTNICRPQDHEFPSMHACTSRKQTVQIPLRGNATVAFVSLCGALPLIDSMHWHRKSRICQIVSQNKFHRTVRVQRLGRFETNRHFAANTSIK